MPPSEIRNEARESLKGKWGKAACITLAFLAFSMLVGFVQGFINEDSIAYDILEVAYLIINVPLSFGLIISFIKLKRGEEVSAFDFIQEGFNRFSKSWGIAWHTFIRLLLPIVCLVLIVVLHFILMFANANVQLNAMFSLVYIVLLIATIIYIACRALLYVLAYYVSFDNSELSSKECVKKSEELMKGHRGNYFMLEFSFIGWFLLLIIATSIGTAVLSFLFVLSMGILGSYISVLAGYLIMIIGMLFLMPYIQVATVCFYERVINKKETEKVEE